MGTSPPDFIVIDGPDGCGKTTQVRLLRDQLSGRSVPVSSFRDPGETAIGEAVRELLLDADREEMTARTETFLYMASRAQLVDEKLRPALENGKTVLLDRYYYSTAAYQGVAGEVPLESILDMAETATGGLDPDLTIILDLPAEVGLERNGGTPDRMERKGLEYHRAVRNGFLQLADRFADHTVVVDATQSIETVHRIICRHAGL